MIIMFPEVFGLIDATSNSARFSCPIAPCPIRKLATTKPARPEYDFCGKFKMLSVSAAEPAYYLIDDEHSRFVRKMSRLIFR